LWALKKRSLPIASISLATIGVVIASAGVFIRRQDVNPKAGKEAQHGPIAATPGVNIEGPPGVNYKIARVIRSSNEKNKVYLDISVEPQYFIRDKMVFLARRLNQDFPNEPRLEATIFDDENIARNIKPIGAAYDLYKKVVRGEYHLNRIKGEEHIQFSTERGKPSDEIKVKLGHTPAKNSTGQD
jgi:hypothetical protein